MRVGEAQNLSNAGFQRSSNDRSRRLSVGVHNHDGARTYAAKPGPGDSCSGKEPVSIRLLVWAKDQDLQTMSGDYSYEYSSLSTAIVCPECLANTKLKKSSTRSCKFVRLKSSSQLLDPEMIEHGPGNDRQSRQEPSSYIFIAQSKSVSL